MTKAGYRFGGVDLLMNIADNQRKNKYLTLVYIKEGMGMYTIGASLRCLNQGDMMILPSSIDYRFDSNSLGDEYNENINALVMMFDESWLNDLINVFPNMSSTVMKIKEIKNPLSVTGPKWMKISSMLCDYMYSDPAGKPLLTLSLLQQMSTATDVSPILSIHTEEEFSIPEKIEMINRYLECNLRNKIMLEDVASYVMMNRTYFCMFFKKHFKEGFADYVNRKRIEKSCQMLGATDKNMETIVSECGFKTVPYFTRVFTKVMGTTPGKFRASLIVNK